jgi:hypothetical protein
MVRVAWALSKAGTREERAAAQAEAEEKQCID